MITAHATGTTPEQMQARITKLITKLDGRDPSMYRQISVVLDESTTENFHSAGRPTWKPRKYQYRWPILRKTLLMMRKALSYIRSPWKRQGNKHIKEIKTTEYGYYHQYGKGQEVRPFVKIQPEDDKIIQQIIMGAAKWLIP